MGTLRKVFGYCLGYTKNHNEKVLLFVLNLGFESSFSLNFMYQYY